MLANYFILNFSYFSFENEDGHNKFLKKMADEALAKARSYKATAKPISTKDLKNINKKITKELRILKKSVRLVNANRIESEKLKAIEPITITASTVFLFVSVASSLFLAGGFLYTKFLLSFFDINVSDFFDISDYLSSSIDVIFSVFMLVFFVNLFQLKHTETYISETITAELFDEEIKSSYRWRIIIIITTLSSVLFGIMLSRGIFALILLYPLIIFGVDYILFGLLKIDKYVKNKFAFGIIVGSLIVFMTYLGINVSQTLHKVRDPSYQSPYILSFKKEYKEYADHDFFLANSQYVFLLNKDTKEIVVIPKTGIKAIRPTPAQDDLTSSSAISTD